MRYTEEQIRVFADAWKRRMAEERSEVEERRRTLEARLPLAASSLRALGAGHVWLVGSLAWGLFDGHSDVDIAVRGLSPDRELDGLSEVSKLLETRVDLIRIETVDAAFASRIEREGRPL